MDIVAEILSPIDSSPLAISVITCVLGAIIAAIGWLLKRPITRRDNGSNTTQRESGIVLNDIQANNLTIQVAAHDALVVNPNATIPKGEFSVIASRLQELMTLINQGLPQSKQINESRIAELLGEESAEATTLYFQGLACPSFSYLDCLADLLGVEKDWLKDGSAYGDRIFTPAPTESFYPSEAIYDIYAAKPSTIYFVLCESEEKEATIILEQSEYKFQAISRGYPLDIDHVGATGQRQILSFIELSKQLFRTKQIHCSGFSVTRRQWEELMSGKVWPGRFPYIAKREGRWLPFWADDLCDINHEYSVSKEYEKKYGAWFVRTQRWVKQQLEKNQAH